MKPNIIIISSVHNWNDTRIFYKEATSLEKKFNVELHAIANFKNKKINGIYVKGLPNYKSRILRPLNWIKLLNRIIKSKSKVIHFHDPELIILGLFFKLFTNKKIVYDIHEDYTKTILNKSWLGPLWLRNIIAKIYNSIEDIISSFFDLNIIVLDKWSNKYKNPLVIKNYPIVEDLNFKNLEKNDHIVYIGSLGKKRGIEEMIESFNRISNKNITFDLIGKWDTESIREKMLPKINSNENINFLGYLPINEAKKYLKEAKLGFCLYTDKKHEENIPVKMYEYLSYGTPVLYSDFESWKNKIGKEGWGIAADPFDVEEISKIIDEYFEDNKFNYYFNNCLQYRDKYNWENEETKLLNSYNYILQERGEN
jgi:glycosyltransferase involved in cell wall biosynthesis